MSARKIVAILTITVLFSAAASAQQRWDFSAYQQAMQASGRRIGGMDEKSFQAAQQRKQVFLDQIKAMLTRDFGAADPAVLKAFHEVPREYYMYDYEAERNLGAGAYETAPREWKIGYGSVLTDYVMQAYMTAKCRPKPDGRVAGDRDGQRVPELAPVPHRQAGVYHRDHHHPR